MPACQWTGGGGGVGMDDSMQIDQWSMVNYQKKYFKDY
jgi:hypothetical protein